MGRSRVRRILASIAVCGLVTVATTAATVPDAHARPSANSSPATAQPDASPDSSKLL